LVTVALLPNIPLGTMTGIDRERSEGSPATGPGESVEPTTG
jgi:hypothetical protein